jgi:acetyl esterase
MPVHPDVAARFHYLDGLISLREAYTDPALIQQIRQFETWDPGQAPPAVHTRDESVPGPHGPVPVRIYAPYEMAPVAAPCLVWVHGGGFIGGDLDMREADWTAREVCAAAGAVVISVDYRLAVGGVCYPVPHDDTVTAVAWARDRASDLGIDPARIAIGGASAGGNLTAGAALKLRDRDGWMPAALTLVYPVLHARVPAPSASLAAGLAELPPLFQVPAGESSPLAENYLGGPLSSADGYAFAAGAILDGLCPTLVLNAEYDHLRASGEAFTAAAAVAGVDVRQVTIRGMLHGFLNLPAEVEPVRAMHRPDQRNGHPGRPMTDGLAVAPHCRVILDNDYQGDPDGLVALAHHLLAPANCVVGVTSSFLNPRFPVRSPRGRRRGHGPRAAGGCGRFRTSAGLRRERAAIRRPEQVGGLRRDRR